MSTHIERFDRHPPLRPSRKSRAAPTDGVLIELDTFFDRSSGQSSIETSHYPYLFLSTLAPDTDTHLRMLDLGYDEEIEERPVNRKADECRTLNIRKMSMHRNSSVSLKESAASLALEAPSIAPVETNYFPWSAEIDRNLHSFEYLLELEKEEEGWSKRVDKPFASISIKLVPTTQGSEYNSELPIVRAWFDMELPAKPSDLLKILHDVETRKKWDQASVLDYVEFERPEADVALYYMMNKAPWPFADRDFVERRMVRRKKNGDVEVFYRTFPHPVTTSQDYPMKKKIERGETLIGGQIIRTAQGPSGPTLHVTILNQADMKGKIPAKALTETLPASLEKWYRSVRKVLASFLETGSV